ncbi:MAG: asparagine synthase (glutamine-hydrolyzing) [Actinomycetota bacterium]|nr:asparagine synthase (glutamine-hydrolyzing) [Actinomycetota bacterium]MCL6094123.1 asparagine synthase (glutamine-hydrolyzing) [Actinomycetota bacterium]MDA8166747.1 asparagine synthase (glutamine-hydrolyzing) [Actinomycetota bacterium]
MSGIAGILKTSGEPVTSEELSRLHAPIAHRGPDGEAEVIRGAAGLAHRFLKIPSAVSVPQPLSSEDGSITLVCDGRVYNHAQLRSALEAKGHRFSGPGDVEVLIHLYEEEGERFLERVNGMYGFALWDDRRRRLLLGRDRIGVKPLYYTRTADRLLFGSEIKAVLADPAVKRRVNFRAMSDFFGLSYIFDGETIFDDVMALPPGCIYIASADGENRLERYWDMDFAPDHPWDEAQLVEQGRAILKEAVELEAADVKPLGIHLSGGIDSSFITSLAADMDRDRLITLSAGFREQDYDERNYALMAAEKAGVVHKTVEVYPDPETFTDTMKTVIWHVDEPTVSPGIHSFYVLNEFTARFVKVILGGQGSNELLAGYNRYIMSQIADRFSEALKRLRLAMAIAEVREMKDFYGPKPLKRLFLEVGKSSGQRALRVASTFAPHEKEKLFSARLKQDLGGYTTEEHYLNGFASAPAATTIDRMMYLDMKNMMPNMLRILDRTCSAFGVEARTPFLDHHFVEFACSLSDDAVLKGTESKYILKKMGEGILKHDTIYRDKSGFAAPVTPWLQGHLKREARDILLSEQALSRGYFDVPGLKSFIERHERTGKGVWQVWMLLIFELWHRSFID